MTPLAGDPSLYLKNKEGRTIPLLGSCVDDTLLGGNEDFQNISEQTLVKFDSKPRQWGSTEFLGVCVETLPGECSSYKLSQPLHIRALKEMPTDITFDRFRSVRAAFAWIFHTRPEVCCAINRAAQGTAELFSHKHVTELNKAIKTALSKPGISLIYRSLEFFLYTFVCTQTHHLLLMMI